jgi:hippurate hydrolase
MAIDPITIACQIHLALQEINSRELAPDEFGVFTTGSFHAGEASNIIPDTAEMCGTIRTADITTSNKIKNRINEICKGYANAMRGEATVEYFSYCPPMLADEKMSACAKTYMKEIFGNSAMPMSSLGVPRVSGGSEDFALVSNKVPTIGMFISAGNPNNGYIYSQHHPKVVFDDSILYRGSAAYAYLAARWLQDNQ